jgi:hypothetical protein
MNLEDILLSEVNEVERNRYFILSFRCGILNSTTEPNNKAYS